MRLLAYGGTSLVERSRFGQWPSVPEGALGDKYSLVGNEFSYGVGLLEDQQPFLILRQRQNLQSRGGYAFTLLLDPGIEVWEKFEWNGAALTLSLLKDSIGQKLLTRPEDFTDQEIDERLRELQEPSGIVRAEETGSLQSLWVGAIVAKEQVIVSPKDVGFDPRPSMETVASSLSALLPCFRCGYGWLMGGSKEHGEAFGAHLIFDEGAPGNSEKNGLIREGGKIVASLKTLAESDTYKKDIEQQSKLPVFRWNARFQESPKELLVGMQTTAKYLIGDPETAEEEPEYRGQVYKEAIKKERYKAVLSGKHILNKAQTKLVLDEYFAPDSLQRETLTPEEVKRLHPQAVIDELVRRGKRPTEEDTRMRLRAEIRLEVWRKLIEAEGEIGKIPLLLKDGMNDLFADSLKGQMAMSEISEVVELAIQRTVAKSGELKVWIEFRDTSSLQPFINERLRKEVMRRAKESSRHEWWLDYLAFGDDLGGKLLAQSGLQGREASSLVAAILAELQREGKLKQEAHRWLAALAYSQFRVLVPLPNKLDVAKTLNEPWNNLLVLWQLYCGQEPDVDASATIATGVERDALRDELREMIRTRFVGSAVPDLKGIIKLLGNLSVEEVDALAELKPPLTYKSAGRWLDGWRALNRDDVCQQEIVRLLRSNEEIPEDFSLDQLEQRSLCETIRDTLARGDEGDDDISRRRLKYLLKRDTEDTRFAAAISSALQEIMGDSGRAAVLARRFRRRSPATELLFERIDALSQDELIALFAESNEEQFKTEAYKLYGEALDSKRSLRLFDRAVLRFLRSARGKRFKARVSDLYYGFLETEDTIDKNLRRLLDEPEAEKPDENLEESYWSIYDFLAAPIKNVCSYLFEFEEEAKTETPTEALTEPEEGKGEESKSLNSARGVDESADSDDGDS